MNDHARPDLRGVLSPATPARLVHIVRDEKFIDWASREFDIAHRGLNDYVIVGRPHPLRYLRSTAARFVDLRELAAMVAAPEVRAVVMHSLSLSAVARIPPGKRIAWIGWGYDYYDDLLASAFPGGLLLPLTRREVRRRKEPTSLGQAARGALSAARRMAERRFASNRRLLSRIDYFSPVLDTEYELVRALHPWFRARYLPFNYATVEDDLDSDASARPSTLGGDILVGNSASRENNHFDAFEGIVRGFDTKGRRIYVPLSYGEAWYADAVREEGQRRFGRDFVPLTTFLAHSEYSALLARCGFVFMHHRRQAGLGNICIQLLRGAKVYMNPDSPAYSWLLSRGAVLGAPLCGTSAVRQELRPLDVDAQRANREVVLAHWGRGRQRARLRAFVGELLS